MWKGLILSVAILSVCSGVATAQISGTAHDFSLDSGETRVCVFCHTPHNANPAKPLWNHRLSSEVYALYPGPASDPKSSLERDPIQPEIGSSTKLCLSCHDGTIGIGDYFGSQESIGYVSGDALIAEYNDTLNRDLSNDHPVSIELVPRTPDKDTELINPADNPSSKTKLEGINVECGSCHDPHDNTIGNFLVNTTDDGELCLECHYKSGWMGSAHQVATQVWNDKNVGKWACLACHQVHNSSGNRLLKVVINESGNDAERDNESGLCLSCHNGLLGSVATGDIVPNIVDEFDKTFNHTVFETVDTHYPTENILDTMTGKLELEKHVECVDCHDPHQGESEHREIGHDEAGGMLRGVKAPLVGKGIEVYPAGPWLPPKYGAVDEIKYEYELCLKCHGTISNMLLGEPHQEHIDVYFNPNNEATHGSIAPGRMPKTAKAYDTFSQEFKASVKLTEFQSPDFGLACSDCHGNDKVDSPIAGPHGSDKKWLLRSSGPNEDDFVCYLCHDRSVYAPGGINGSKSRFPYHTQSGHSSFAKISFPTDVDFPRIGCLACHGDFSKKVVEGYSDHLYTAGGLHGANDGNQQFSNENSTGYHFLNGFALKLTTAWNEAATTVSCGDVMNTAESGAQLGCNFHDSGGKTEPYTYTRGSF